LAAAAAAAAAPRARLARASRAHSPPYGTPGVASTIHAPYSGRHADAMG
jgi:hypothetical protein